MEGASSQPNGIPPSDRESSLTSTDEELQNQIEVNNAQKVIIRCLEKKEELLTAKVEELRKGLRLAKENEQKLKEEMGKTKKWVVGELKLLLTSEDKKDNLELVKEKLKNAQVYVEKGFWKRRNYRKVIREQKLKSGVLETTLKETELELQMKDEEVQGLRRKLESAKQEKQAYLERIRGAMEQLGEVEGLLEVPEAEGKGNVNPGELGAEVDGEHPVENEGAAATSSLRPTHGNPIPTDQEEVTDAEGVGKMVIVVRPQRRASTEGKFKCQECPKRFFNLAVCLKHMKKQHSNKRRRGYPCSSCGKVFKTAIMLFRHQQRSHKKTKIVPALTAPPAFSPESGEVASNVVDMNQLGPVASCSSSSNNQQVSETSRGQRKLYTSELQSKSYHFRERQNEQQRGDLNAGSSTSNKKRTRRPYVMDHINVLPGSPPEYECKTCRRKFRTKRQIKLHEYCVKGEAAKPFQCNVCSKGFLHQSAFLSHSQMHNPQQKKERPFVCNHCKKRFFKKQDLKNHTMVHTGERPFFCSHCKKTFIQKIHFKRHVKRNITGIPHSCKWCDKTFLCKASLRQHVVIHIGKIGSFKCPFNCGKSMRTKTGLNYHLNNSHPKPRE